MKKIIAIVLVLVLAVSLCACGGKTGSTPASTPAGSTPAGNNSSAPSTPDTPDTPDDTVYTFSWASSDGEEALRVVHLEKAFMDYVTEKSNGRIKFEFYGNGSLAGTGSIIQGCKDGICDFGVDAPTFYAGQYLYNELMGTPGINMGDTYEEKQEHMNQFFDAYIAPELSNDVHPICTFVTLNTYLLTNKEIKSVDDFKNETVATSANYFPVFTSMGCATTGANYGEAYESIRLGVIDMLQAGYGLINNFRFYEVTNYAYFLPFVASNSVVVMRKEAYEELPADLQAIIDEAGAMMTTEFNQNFIAANEEIVESKVAEGNPSFQWTELPQDVLDYMGGEFEKILQAKVDELNAAGLDGDGAFAMMKSFEG